MNDAEIAFQICMNDLFCFGERQFTEREPRPDDTSFEIERRRENDFSPTVPMSAGVNISLLPSLSPSVTLEVPAEFVPH